MATRILKDGEELEVGDAIEISPNLGGSYFKLVTRVTKIFAFVKWNEKAEGKFPRIVDYRFQSLPREKWRTTQYKVHRVIDGK